MAFCELKYYNKALGKSTACDILLPEQNKTGPFPVLYLLHGYSDDNTIWQRRTSIERYVQNLPLIVVMPDASISFYCDAVEGLPWETAIVRDLVGYVDTLFQTNATREGRCLAGLSMGGYGAAKFALKFPDVFCAAVSHSGAMRFAHGAMPYDADEKRRTEQRHILGNEQIGGANDLFALAAKLTPEQRPALRIDCGTEDFLIEHNREFDAYLTEIGFPHEYVEFPGDHNWEYWDAHIQEAITFLKPHIGL